MVIQGDAMRITPAKDVKWIIGNIDYAITSPLLARIDEMYAHSEEHRPSISLLIQREVADRLSPRAVGRARSSLGMVLGLSWDIELGRILPAARFTPRPAVDGRIMILRPSPAKGDDNDLRLARRLIRAGYAHRRRKLSNVFERTPNKIERVRGWDKHRWGLVREKLLNNSTRTTLEKRAEELGVGDWIELAERFNRANMESDSTTN
ncbi:MAG TPA: rRNA adenine N-6-methyltransferase family protein [Candidatus Poseidoniales archaeon]|nr:rRNA adenine N-6-methyltransferase family protein [Candidatus Poseidoniales archaeon]